jgi:hypothetical protein
MKETLNELILSGFYSQKGFEGSVNTIKEAVLTQQMSAFEAAEKLYQQFSR